jgi:KDO2-lipid IV(A) lauroyltransferase
MNHKKIKKDFIRLLSFSSLVLCSLILNLLPGKWLYGFAGVISAIGYRLAKKQRKVACESLAIAFGNEKSAKEREKIARDCFLNIAKSAIELLFFLDRPLLLKSNVRLVNKENLDQALLKGRGVILVSAHFGNFPLMLGRLVMEGYKTAGIMRPMHDEMTEKFFLRKRKKYNLKTIYSQPRIQCVENTLKFLRENGIVFIPLDQNYGTGGIFVNFFGKKAATATGPVVLSQRTKAVILPCFIIRQQDETHKVIFEKPLVLSQTKVGQDAVTEQIQELTCIIESYIRRYPAEWGWIHKRWKSRPN